MIQSPDSGRRSKPGGPQAAITVAVVSVAMLTAWTAVAADWSAVSVLSERFEFDDNLGVDIDSPGDIFAATSSATLELIADDPHYRFTANGALSYRNFSGSGADDEPNTLSESIDAGLEIPGPTYDVSFAGSFARADATFTETLEDFEELGVVTSQTDRVSVSATVGLDVEVDSTNSLTFTAKAQSVDFENDGSGLTPFVDYSASAGWSKKVNESTTASPRRVHQSLRSG